MPSLTRLAVAAVAAAAVAAPAAAQADSISYIKDGNVWLSTPDGSRQHQVTTDGGYSFASQADDGTLVALWGRRIRKLDRVTGAVQADFATPVSDTPPNSHFTMYGPFDPVISPDGQRIAYYYQAHYDEYDPYCGYPNGCRVGKWVVGTGYSHSDRLTGWDEPGFKQHSGWQYPAWYDNDHVVLSYATEILNMDVWFDTVGDDQYGQEWFSYNQVEQARDVEVNRQQTALVSVGKDGGEWGHGLEIQRMNGAPPAGPTLCRMIKSPTGREWLSPTWSPDGTQVVVGDGNDLYVYGPVDLSDASCNSDHWRDAVPQRTLVAGASAPDWGPADVPPARPAAGGSGGSAGGVTSGGGATTPGGKTGAGKGGQSGAGGAALKATIGPASLAKALKGGLVVKVSAPGAGSLKATASRGGKAVAKAPARAVTGGSAKVKLMFTKAGKRALAKARSAKLSIAVTFTPKGGAPQRRTVAATLRR